MSLITTYPLSKRLFRLRWKLSMKGASLHTLELCIGIHSKLIAFNIIFRSHHFVILSISWLESHNPIIYWRLKDLILIAQWCTNRSCRFQNIVSSFVQNHMIKHFLVANTTSCHAKSCFVEFRNHVVKNPKMIKTNPNHIDNTAKKSNCVQIFFFKITPSYWLSKLFKPLSFTSILLVMKNLDQVQNLSSFWRSTRTLPTYLRRKSQWTRRAPSVRLPNWFKGRYDIFFWINLWTFIAQTSSFAGLLSPKSSKSIYSTLQVSNMRPNPVCKERRRLSPTLYGL